MAKNDEITTADILAQYGPTPQAKPKDEHGFLFSNIGGELKFNPWEHIKGFMGYRAPPGALSTSGDSKPIEDAFNAAGWVGLSGMGLNAFGAVPANAVGSAGARLAAKAAPAIERELDPLGFYSAALEGAKSWPMERGSPQQALAHLKKSGTKDAEIAATGLDKYLADQDVITRQALENYLRENRVQLKENKYGGNEVAQEKWLEQAREREFESMLNEYEVYADPQDGLYRHYLYGEPTSEQTWKRAHDAEDALRYELEDGVRSMSDRELRERWFGDGPLSKKEEALWPQGLKGEAKWQEYALDTENPTYRESVLHLPPNSRYEISKPDPKGYVAIKDRDTGEWVTQAGTQNTAKFLSEEEAQRAIRQLGSDRSFRSGHWDEPNVVAHMRTSIQPDEAGRPTFLIDELQSDWGQKLREGGVRDEAKIKDIRAQLADNEAQQAKAFQYGYDLLERTLTPGSDMPQGATELSSRLHGLARNIEVSSGDVDLKWRAIRAAEAVDRTINDAERFRAELRTAEAVSPGHPLVNTTDQWTTTGIRRLLQQAAEADAAGIALTPGQLQNERFGLEKHVSELSYNPSSQTLTARLHNGRRGETFENTPPEKLASIVGKEAAEKLLAQPLTDDVLGYQGHVLSGTDLKLGGEGMKYSYDSMYPRKIRDVLKKLDPDHPGITQRHLVPTDFDTKGMVNVMGDVDKMSSKYQAWQRYKEGTPYEHPFHYFELTPRAKEEIRKGLPLFSMPGVPVADLLRAYYGDEKE